MEIEQEEAERIGRAFCVSVRGSRWVAERGYFPHTQSKTVIAPPWTNQTGPETGAEMWARIDANSEAEGRVIMEGLASMGCPADIAAAVVREVVFGHVHIRGPDGREWSVTW